MKYLVLFALIALAAAGPARKEEKPADEKKPAADEKPHEKARLQWPMPDPSNEGDLMLHGSISYDRVRDLHKEKLEDEADKMVLAHGRTFLRRVLKFLDENVDFKIEKSICQDSRNLNSTINRWRIEIPKPAQDAQQPAPAIEQGKDAKEAVQRDDPLPKEQPEKVEKTEKADDEPLKNNATFSNETESNTTTTEKPTEKPTDKSSDKPTEKPFSTTVRPDIPEEDKEKDKDFEVRRRDFYRDAGANLARLLMKEYRKETLVQEETDYLARWLNDEAVHYGAMAIYCIEGENVKEIKKQLTTFVEEKVQ